MPARALAALRRWVSPGGLGQIVLFLLILGAAAGIRLQYIQRSAARTAADLDFDARYYYVSGAQALLDGRGFDWEYHHRPGPPPYAVVPPLQSLFLAAAFRIAGRGDLVRPLYFQLLINLAAGAILFALMRRWCGRAAAFAVWAGWAVYPDFIRWVATPLTENNYLFYFAATLWLVVRWARRPTAGRAAWAAVLMGLTNLQRAVGLLLNGYLALLALAVLRGRARWLHAALLLAIPLAVMSPWLARNLAFNGDPVWTSCNGGLLLQMANNINSDAKRWPDLAQVPPSSWKVPEIENRFAGPEFDGPRHTWFRYSELYMPVFESYVLHHPIHFLRNYLIRFWNQFAIVPATLWGNEEISRVDEPTRSYDRRWEIYGALTPLESRLIDFGLLGLGLLGLLASPGIWRDPAHRALAVSFFYFASFGALMPGLISGRYNLQLRVFLLLFAGRFIGLALARAFGRRPAAAQLPCRNPPIKVASRNQSP